MPKGEIVSSLVLGLALIFVKQIIAAIRRIRCIILLRRTGTTRSLIGMLEHVVLNYFNIWNNMSKKMSYEGAFDIAPAELD